MIDKAKIVELVKEQLDEGMFLVEVQISTTGVIRVFIDSFDGITIERCVQISRHLESNLDREVEDFELQVSSSGLSEPFRVKEQYYKNTGREIELITSTGEKHTGLLKLATPDYILLETQTMEKAEGQKKKQLTQREHKLEYSEIKSAKVVVSFK
jgi:ribosome maturation factor RimP